ncbi:MAG: MFS transporter [Anaerolineae bacterium]|nr:MFS transporter [Anaerolineae bacterium]MDW8069547.1 MFS transporter [Anaerolineae bacterium]
METAYREGSWAERERREIMPPHFRHNFIALLIDYFFFGVAYSFLNPNTVLPAFARTLTDSEPLVGMVSTIMAAGWLLPQLLAAAVIGRRPRKKPYLLRAIYIGRPTYFLLALVIWAGLPRYPGWMMVAFLAGIGLFNLLDGIASVAWFDLMGAAIPPTRRGRLVGAGQLFGGLAGIGVGGLVGVILSSPAFPYPTNYGLLFALAGLALVPSNIALTLLREPERGAPSAPAVSFNLGSQLQEVWSGWPDFRRLVFARWLIGLFGLALPFYILHATEVIGLPQAVVGWFVSAQMVGGIAASVGLGWLHERWGPRAAIWAGAAATLISPLLALLVHLSRSYWLAQTYPLVYFFYGVTNNTWMMGMFNYLLEIAPEDRRPLFVGLYNTLGGLLVPVSFLGGVLLRFTSYPFLFAVTALGVAGGFWISLRLRDTRSESRGR